MVNDPYISTDYMIYLFKFDSTHGPYPLKLECENGHIIIGGIYFLSKINKFLNFSKIHNPFSSFFFYEENKIATSQEKNPCKINWRGAGVTYVIESTGLFTTLEKASVNLF